MTNNLFVVVTVLSAVSKTALSAFSSRTDGLSNVGLNAVRIIYFLN